MSLGKPVIQLTDMDDEMKQYAIQAADAVLQ